MDDARQTPTDHATPRDAMATTEVATENAFAASVRRVLAGLGAGEVVTYGEVAREAGHEGAARAVGTLLARDDSDLPWWRVVTSTGRLVPGHEREHARRLREEGIDVGGRPPRVRSRRQRGRRRRQGVGTPPAQALGLTPRSRRT